MKKLITVVFLALVSLPSAFGTALIGKMKAPNGNSFNGKVTFTLNAAGAIDTSVVPAQLLAMTQSTFAVVNGKLPANASLVGNDVISPNGTVYLADWFDSFGTRKMSNVYLISGATTDIGASGPSPITTSNVSIQSLFLPGILQVNGQVKFLGPFVPANVNGVLYANSFATGGTGIVSDPWTSASGTGGIGEAIAAAGVADGGNARIHIPSGYYNLTTCINATSSVATAPGNSAPPSPLIFDGDGPGKTILVGNTGGCMMDSTGRVPKVSELSMLGGVTNQSTIGILLGRTTGSGASAFTPGAIVDHVVIDLPSIPAANGANDTIGIYAYSAEGGRYYNNDVTAAHPYVFTSNNIFSIASAYQTQNTTLRFVSQNHVVEGNCTVRGIVGGECILIQGQAANFEINHVAGECTGGTPSPVFLRIKAPTAPDSASTPLVGLNIQNVQAECPTGGQLIVNEQILADARIHGTVKNLVNVPIILLTTAASQLLDPFIDLQAGNAGVSSPMVSDGGVATAGILGGVVMLPATTTIAFTNAATACNNVTILASYASPSITCNNATGTGVGGTLIGYLFATDGYYMKGTGASNYNSNTSHAWNVAGNQIMFCSAVFCSINIQAAFLNHLNISEIASPGPGAGGTTRIYADSTAHNLQASYNGDALSKLMRSSDLAAPPAIGGTTPAAGTFTTLQASTFERTGVSNSRVSVASDFTTINNTSLQNITGLTWTFPATAAVYSFHCSILYSQATSAVSDTFGIQAVTNAPTNIMAQGNVFTSLAGAASNGNQPTITTTAATAFVSFTPGATATNFNAALEGTIELPASVNTINLMVSTSAGADVITIRRGSYCNLF